MQAGEEGLIVAPVLLVFGQSLFEQPPGLLRLAALQGHIDPQPGEPGGKSGGTFDCMVMPFAQLVQFGFEVRQLLRVIEPGAESGCDPRALLRRPVRPRGDGGLGAADLRYPPVDGITGAVRHRPNDAQCAAEIKRGAEFGAILGAEQCGQQVATHGCRTAPGECVQNGRQERLLRIDPGADPQD